MVWVVEKKIFRYILNVGPESVEIPVRVKFEFEISDGSLVHDTLTKEILYNQGAIEKHYPQIQSSSLDKAIEEMVVSEIMKYLGQCGFIGEAHDAG